MTSSAHAPEIIGLNNRFAFIPDCYNREWFYKRRWDRRNERHKNPLGANSDRWAACGSGSHSRDCSSWLASRRQFPALHCSSRILRHVLPGSALGVSTDRIPFHSAWDTGRSGRGPYLRCLDTRPVRTFRIHRGPRAETRGRCVRRLRRPRAPIAVSGGNRSRLIHCLTGSAFTAKWSAHRNLVRKRASEQAISLTDPSA